jgi:hypothetical protein
VLERGVGLGDQATLIDCPLGVMSFGREHRAWVRDCLPVLADAFEPETVVEFLHLNARIPSTGETRLARRAAVAVMGDAVEMLGGLRGTLEQDAGG